MFSGMRLNEICGLRTADVQEEGGIQFFDVISSEDRRHKTKGSQRRIPVHSTLNAIGFGEYLALVRKQKQEYLLSGLKAGGPDQKRSWYISKRFTDLRRAVGIDDPGVVFHSFRNTVATALENAGVPESEAVHLLGHKKLSMSYGLYSKGLSLERLRQVVEAITYPGLGLGQIMR